MRPMIPVGDARGVMAWRLPVAAGADVLTEQEIDVLRALPEPVLIDLIRRVSTAAREMESLERQLASRWVIERVCPRCDGAVYGRSDKVYCSNACRNAAYRSSRS